MIRPLRRRHLWLVAMVAVAAGILLVLAEEHPQRVLNRDQLLDLTQGREASPFDRSIDVQVSRLRRRLRDDPREAVIIKTVRNEGYLLAAHVSREF